MHYHFCCIASFLARQSIIMMYYSGIDSLFFFSHLGVALGLWYVEMDDYHVHFVYVVPLKVAFYTHLVKMKVGGTPLSVSRLFMMHAVHTHTKRLISIMIPRMFLCKETCTRYSLSCYPNHTHDKCNFCIKVAFLY